MFKSIKKRLKDQRGLTLVELLAVVVILGIIAGIAVPNIGKIIDKTEDDAKVAEGIQIIQAAKLYATSHKIDFGSDDADTDDDESTFETISHTQLSDYLDNIKDIGTSSSPTTPDYIITITKGNNGKFIYSLSAHDAVVVLNKELNPDVTSVTESQLLDY